MDSMWLANTDPASDWTRFPTGAFGRGAAGRLAILPVYGCGDHGLGLAADAEEVVGAELLRRACAALRKAGGEPVVLPAMRFGPAPYPSQFFGLDADIALDWLREVADGVRRAGFAKLVLVTTNPWQREWTDAAALDLHVETGLEVLKLHLGDIGLALHPAAPMAERAKTQAVAARLLGTKPESCGPGEVRDMDFRPGCFLRPTPVDSTTLPAGFEPDAWLAAAGARCARLLGEASGLTISVDTTTTAGGAVWRPFGTRQLTSLTPAAMAGLKPPANATAIVPVSAVEQHGPHLPVGVDAIIGEGLLAAALAKLSAETPVWVAPAILVGKSVEHREFAGTVSISSRTLRALLKAQVAQLRGLGFSTVAFWNTHGGNSAVLSHTVRELQAEHPGLRVGRLESGYRSELEPQEAAFGFHAGHWETALMLALAPELVDMTRAVSEFPAKLDDAGELRPERGAITRAWTTSELSASGVMGDATKATREQGRQWLEESAVALAGRIRGLLG